MTNDDLTLMKMVPDFLYEFYKVMNINKVMLIYQGEVTQEVTNAFTSVTEADMEKNAESNSIQRKVFHVMVECLQNISRHANEQEIGGVGKGIFMLSKDENKYYITTGNIVETNNIDKIKEFLTHINSLDKEELKILHKKQLHEGSLSDKGGAGLGFIDIVKKAGEKLIFHFLPVDEKFSFFILTVSISRTNNNL